MNETNPPKTSTVQRIKKIDWTKITASIMNQINLILTILIVVVLFALGITYYLSSKGILANIVKASIESKKKATKTVYDATISISKSNPRPANRVDVLMLALVQTGRVNMYCSKQYAKRAKYKLVDPSYIKIIKGGRVYFKPILKLYSTNKCYYKMVEVY